MTPYFTENISTDYYMNLYVKIYLDGSFCLFNRSLVMARIDFVEVLKPTAKFLLLSFKMINNTGLRLKTFFKRSKVFQLILAYFDALNPNILSIFFGQVKFLRYV